MKYNELPDAEDIASAYRSEHRTKTRYPRRIKMSTVAQKAIEKAKAKAAKSAEAKPSNSAKPAQKKADTKKKASKKQEKKSSRVQIKDAKGKIVTGRDNTFTCVECKSEITGPWSYKQHLIKQHNYTPSKAGLNERK
jgi:hypothetical protein